MIKKLFQIPDEFVIRWRIAAPLLVLIFISLLILRHTSTGSTLATSTFYKQLIWLGIGTFVFIAAQWLRIQFFQEYAYHFYFLLIILLISTIYMPVIGGARRWVVIGPVYFQPSEIGKLLFVFAIARFLSDQKENYNQIKVMVIVLFFTIFPVLLVFKQPDFGTALIYLSVVIPMLYWAGIRPFYLFIIIAPAVSIAAAFNLTIFYIWMVVLLAVIYFSQPKLLVGAAHFVLNIICGILAPFVWSNILYSHQRERILTLFNPMRDPQGTGYQVLQSITAIGSGGVWGKGIGEGTQTHLRYLPVRDTDFIISVIGEEMGLFGISIILISFFIFLYWMVTYAQIVSNTFSSLALVGFTTILFVHIVVNMGMTVGILPVTGLPAPFLSYGGSFLLTCIIMIALSNNIINSHI